MNEFSRGYVTTDYKSYFSDDELERLSKDHEGIEEFVKKCWNFVHIADPKLNHYLEEFIAKVRIFGEINKINKSREREYSLLKTFWNQSGLKENKPFPVHVA